MKIIGVSGKARSGKGELAKVAVESYGATVVSFAAGVKEEVAEFLAFVDARVAATGTPWEPRHLYGEQSDKEQPLVLELGDLPLGMPEIHDFLSNPAMCYMPNETVAIFTPRALMQWHGTEYRRAQDSEYWVKKAMAKCVGTGPVLYVIDDCRFENEAKAIKDAGGVLVRVVNPNAPTPSNPDHPSETGLDLWEAWDIIMNNSSDLATYHGMVEYALSSICAADDLERA